MKSRLNVEDDWLKALNFCHPENASGARFHSRNPNLDKIFSTFSLSDLDEKMRAVINYEWNELLKYKFDNDIIQEKKVDVFWAKIMGCVDLTAAYYLNISPNTF